MLSIARYIPFFVLAFVYGYITGHYWNDFSIHYSISEYESRYGHSQYVMGPAYTHLMGDGDIYTYAGIRYVQGENPTAINFEHPPFLKYIFGLSYVLTSIPNWANVFFLIFATMCFWYITKSAFTHLLWRYIALCFFLLNPITYSYYTQTMLDFGTMALSLGVLASYIAIDSSASKIKLVVFSIASGLFIAAKYPLPINVVLILLLLGWLLLKKRLTYIHVCGIGLGITITYLLNYLGFFIHNHTLFEWLKFEWNRWQWYQGKLTSQWGSLFQIIFTGRRPVVWDMCPTYAKVKWWHIGVPAVFLGYTASYTKIKSLINHKLFPYFVWLAVAFIALLFGADSDRFLVPLIPGWVLFGTKWLEGRINVK